MIRSAVAVAACCIAVVGQAQPLTPLNGPAAEAPPPWRVAGLPMQKKPYTRFQLVDLDGSRVLRVEAERSYGNLVHPLPPDARSRVLSWRWRVDVPNLLSNLRQRSGDDNSVEVCAMFDLPLKAVPFVERQVVRMARTRSDELLPTASVCYVWDSRLPSGTVLDNAFTRRVRIIVLRGEGSPTKTWHTERRDLRADFLHLFGDEATVVPPIIGVSVAADADNTQSRSLAFVADVALEP